MSNLAKQIAELSPAKLELLRQRLKQKSAASPRPQTIARRKEPHASAPLSYAQQRLWLLEQLKPGSAAYNFPLAVRLEGELNVAALERVLNEIVRRHDSLRTTFSHQDGLPLQLISPHCALSLPVVELQSLNESERENRALELAQQEAQLPFDLSKGPLLRAKLLRLSQQEHIVLFTLHHIVSDGWSLGVLVKEVASLYEAFSRGEDSPLQELPIQYADYSIWQRGWLSGEVLEKQLSYWREQLKGAPPVLELPTDRPRPAVQSYRGAHSLVEIDKEIVEGLKGISRQEGATLFMVLVAAFQSLLYRMSGQSDISTGTPIAGRTRAETENLIGFFVNTVVLRTKIEGGERFRELVGRVKEVTLGAYGHQDVPFEMLVEELKVERDLSRTPLFQVMFNLLNFQSAATRQNFSFAGLKSTPLDVEATTAKFDLNLTLVESEQGLKGTFEYNTDLFDAATIARLSGHFQTLLRAAVADPEQPVAQLPLLSEAEEARLLLQWNDTAADYPRNKCIHQLFEEQAAATPDRPALLYGGETLSYRELNERANRLAHYLQSLGVGPDVRVGILMERSVEMMMSLLAVLKAGGSYVPLDPSYPSQRLAFMADDALIQVLLTKEKLSHLLADSDARRVCLDGDGDWLADYSKDNPPGGVDSLNLAYVIYTSGSTGLPKGVALAHQSVVNFLRTMALSPGLCESDRLLAVTSISFDIAVLELFLPLSVGASVVIAPQEAVNDPQQLSRLIEATGPSVLQATPSSYRLLLAGGAEKLRHPSLRKLLCGGEALSEKLAHELLALNVELWNMYGPTETTIWSSAQPVHSERVSIGRPIANTQFYILDEQMQPVPVGVNGHLYIGGDGLARGYLNRAELTAERFLPDPFDSVGGGRLYQTGDVARYLSSGEVEYVGRADQQIKLRGYRLEVGEVEAALNRHQEVQQSVVMVRRRASDAEPQLVAYLLMDDEAAEKVSASELRRHLGEQLPDYMIPSLYVKLKEMALTPNGKVDRKALPEPDAGAMEDAQNEPERPLTEIEEMLAGVWGEVLGIARVGIHDNFFELGGHSLLATQVISRLNDKLKIELPLHYLFDAPTIAEFARRVEMTMREGLGLLAPPLEKGTRTDSIPLSFAQQRLWFMQQLEPDSPFYNMLTAIRLHGELNVAALERVLNEIVRRHDSLRTTFSHQDGLPLQSINPHSDISLPIVELQSLDKSEREHKALELARQEAQLPFDLSKGPLLRARLLKLSEKEHVILFTLHHIVSDGWSLGVLVKEVASLYEAFSRGNESPLEELAIQYADYAQWQRQWLSGEVLEKQLSYWREQLKGAPPVLELPTDRPRPAVQSYRGAHSLVEIDKEIVEGLKGISRQEGATLFMVLVAAFQSLLYRMSGQSDISIGTDVANRTRAETEALIGFFVNQLVLRTKLEREESFRELVKQVREVTLGAYMHQEVPFDKVVEALKPARSTSYAPLFQVKVVLQNAPVRAGTRAEGSGLTLSPYEVETGTSQLDMILNLLDRGQSLSGVLEYNTDLFDEATVTRLLREYVKLLRRVIMEPEAKLSTLRDFLVEEERQESLRKEQELEDISLLKLRSIKRRQAGEAAASGLRRKAVKLRPEELIKTARPENGKTLPLIIQPTVKEIKLASWASSNREFIETNLLKYGALLFRNFHVREAAEFEEVIKTISGESLEYKERSSPRSRVSGNVYTSTDYPAAHKIFPHNENSYQKVWPMKVYFFCETRSERGGQTPIVDCRRVYERIDPAIRQRLAEKNWMYVRNFSTGMGLPWQTVFQTTNREAVEEHCRRNGIEAEWREDDQLRIRTVRPVIRIHPRTKEPIWFNHILPFHVTTLEATVRDGLLAEFKEEELPSNSYYGDGTAIEPEVLEHLRTAYREEMSIFDWEEGDVLLLDNMLAAHGREDYEGARRVMVGMAEPSNQLVEQDAQEAHRAAA